VLRLIRASALLLLPLVACDKPVTRDECDALLDRYVELLVKSDSREASSEEILKLQREAKLRAAQDPEFSRCSREVSKKQLDCALRAPSADDVERCLL
jgi:hypothetical protein